MFRTDRGPVQLQACGVADGGEDGRGGGQGGGFADAAGPDRRRGRGAVPARRDRRRDQAAGPAGGAGAVDRAARRGASEMRGKGARLPLAAR
ncbi:hypothetical protein ADK90_05975 [Streptomyces sp. XY413]|nr:hypothetical protein ADK61_19880 [Streptomyces sp. XY66]KOV25580.1 hypothetical protein ADK90_05975 [Streptomyces sp. XY413]KOV33809.1 hypothetical protein ADK97_17670 [Streptomyces sp. H021]